MRHGASGDGIGQAAIALLMMVPLLARRASRIAIKARDAVSEGACAFLLCLIMPRGLIQPHPHRSARSHSPSRCISPEIFAMLALMAVITTLMASPIFERVVGSGTAAVIPDHSGIARRT